MFSKVTRHKKLNFRIGKKEIENMHFCVYHLREKTHDASVQNRLNFAYQTSSNYQKSCEILMFFDDLVMFGMDILLIFTQKKSPFCLEGDTT